MPYRDHIVPVWPETDFGMINRVNPIDRMSTLRGRVKFLDSRDGFERFLDGRDVKNYLNGRQDGKPVV